MSGVSQMVRYFGPGISLVLDFGSELKLVLTVADKQFSVVYRDSEHSRRALLRAFNSFRCVDISGPADNLVFRTGDNDKVITGVDRKET